MNLRNQPLFTIVFILLFLFGAGRAYPSFAHVEGVWEDMVSGQPFDVFLFSIEWVFIFLVFFNAGLIFLPQKIQTSQAAEEKSPAASKDEADFFNRMLRMEDGPDILKSGAWRSELRNAIFVDRSEEIELPVPDQDSTRFNYQGSAGPFGLNTERQKEGFTSGGVRQFPPKPNLLIMDLDEVSKTGDQNSVIENGLSRRIEDLLHEQDAVIFGEGSVEKSNDGQHNEEGADEPENEAYEGSSIMRVVYRSTPAGGQIPEFLQKVFAARNDPSFYKQLEDLLSV